MNGWYKVRVRYTKQFPDGTLKKVTEAYLINSISHTDAEARIHKEIGEFVRGEFLVVGIAPINILDIFDYEDSDNWVKAKIAYVSEDADSGKEKKIVNYFFVSADNLQDAYKRFQECLKGLMVSWSIEQLSNSNIVDMFPYEAAEGEDMVKPITY